MPSHCCISIGESLMKQDYFEGLTDASKQQLKGFFDKIQVCLETRGLTQICHDDMHSEKAKRSCCSITEVAAKFNSPVTRVKASFTLQFTVVGNNVLQAKCEIELNLTAELGSLIQKKTCPTSCEPDEVTAELVCSYTGSIRPDANIDLGFLSLKGNVAAELSGRLILGTVSYRCGELQCTKS